MPDVDHIAGIDAYQLYEERAARPTHTVKVLVLDAQTDASELDVHALRAHVAKRLHSLPALRRIAVAVPARLFHHAWVDRGLPDLDYHVQSVESTSLERLAGELAATPLPRDRPLWRLWLVVSAGLPTALMLQLGHALADGHASARLVEVLFGAEGATVSPTALAVSHVPTRGALVRSALRELGRATASFPSHVRKSLRSPKDANDPDQKNIVGAFSGPRVPWGGRLTPGRSVAWTSIPMREVARARAALDLTVGEFVLAVVSGALKAHLETTGATSGKSLTAVVPVGPPEWSDKTFGNFHRHTFTTLATDEPDLRRRVERVASNMRANRKRVTSESISLWSGWMTYYPLFRASYLISVVPMGRLFKKPPASMIVSTVRGPREELRVANVPIARVYSVGVLTEHLGLNITVWSYGDELAFSVCCAAEHGTLAPALAGQVTAAAKELVAAPT